MKNRCIALPVLAFITSCVLCACNSSGNKGEAPQVSKDSVAQSNIAKPDTTDALTADWEKFRAGADEKIRQNEDSIHVFKKRIAKKSAKIKARLNKQIARIGARNNVMKERLTNYKDEGKDKLEIFKTDFDNSMDTLSTSIKNIFKSRKN